MISLGTLWWMVLMSWRRSSGLLWEKRSTEAIERRMPSQMQEWMFLSTRIRSPFCAKAATLDMQEM